MRKIKFVTGNFYHVFNRGVDKREIFTNKSDYFKFLLSVKDFNNKLYKSQRNLIKRREAGSKLTMTELSSVIVSVSELKLVEVLAYCLLPNHYHFVLKQLVDDGISIFMHKIGTGYTNYFNLKNDRTGALFQGPFKSVAVETDEQLLYLSAYVNGNAEIHKVAAAGGWRWGSYGEYCGASAAPLCDTKPILEQFKGMEEYKTYVEGVIKESAGRKEEVKRYLLE